MLKRDLRPGTGKLVVLRDERALATLSVHLFSVGSTAWGPVGFRDESPVSRATFILLDSDGNIPSELADLTCVACLGTGFCRECRGESLADDCPACAVTNGLCSECRGYGRDGDHVIASTVAQSRFR